MLSVPINFGLGSFAGSGACHGNATSSSDALTLFSPQQHFGLHLSLSQQAEKRTTILGRAVEFDYKVGLGLYYTLWARRTMFGAQRIFW